MKTLKLIVGIINILIGFLLLISDELPGQDLNLFRFIFTKIVSFILLLAGYKILKSLNILDEYTNHNRPS